MRLTKQIPFFLMLLAAPVQAGWWECALAIVGGLPQDKEEPRVVYRLTDRRELASPPKNFVSAFSADHPVTVISERLKLQPKDYTYFPPEQWIQFLKVANSFGPFPANDTKPANTRRLWRVLSNRLELQMAKDKPYVRVPTWYVEFLSSRTDEDALSRILHLATLFEIRGVPYGADIRDWSTLASMKLNKRAERAAKWHFNRRGSINFSPVLTFHGGVLRDYREQADQLNYSSENYRWAEYLPSENRVTLDVVGTAASSGPFQQWHSLMEHEIVAQISRAAIVQSAPRSVLFLKKAEAILGTAHEIKQTPEIGVEVYNDLKPQLFSYFFNEVMDRIPYLAPNQVCVNFIDSYEYLFNRRVSRELEIAVRALVTPTPGRTYDLDQVIKQARHSHEVISSLLEVEIKKLPPEKILYMRLQLEVARIIRDTVDEVLGFESSKKADPANHRYSTPELEKAVMEILSQKERYLVYPQVYADFRQALEEERTYP